MLGLQLFSKECSQFFLNLVNDSIKLREEGKIAQMDMMQLLIEAKQEYEAQQQTGNQPDERQTPKTSITTEDINSQAFTFFFAGFESVARTLCFMAHELAVNPDVQQRLREEIGKVVHQCHEKLTYDILMEMKYLDMVVAEVLRKYPIQIGTDRICTKPYVIEPSTEGEKPVHIPAGLSLAIPTYSLHHDPRLFPNPEKFDPERFSDENKSEIEPYAYQPFGIGPRICIGSRFALMEIKLVVFHLLAKFEIVPVEKTKIPLVYKKSMLTLSSEYGFWLGLKRV